MSPVKINRPLPLETFVKSDERATERLVAKEYQVLDMSGEVLTGRKARGHLRRSPSTQFTEEDDGFELV